MSPNLSQPPTRQAVVPHFRQEQQQHLLLYTNWHDKEILFDDKFVKGSLRTPVEMN